jgi:MFS family permease
MKTPSKDIETLAEKYPSYIAQVKQHYRWNYVLFILESCSFCVSLAIFSPDTILPLLVSTLSAHPFFIGLIPAINYLGFYLPQIAGAFLLQGRQTRKEVVFRITIIQRIATLLVTLVVQSIPGFPAEITLLLFFISYTLFSLTNGMIGPPYSDLTNKTIIYNRGVYFGVLSGVTGLVGFATSLLARHLLDVLPYPQNFHVMFWLACGISLLSPIFVAAFRETPFPEARPVEPLAAYLKAIPTILKSHSAYRNYLIGRILVSVAFMANSFYALHAIQKFDLPVSAIGLLTMVILISKSAMGFAWGWLGDHFGYKLVMLGMVSTLLLATFCALAIPTAGIIFIIAFLIGSVQSATWISDPNMIFELAPPAETGRYIGITNTLIGPVMVLAPLIGGVIVDIFSYQILFSICLCFAGAGFLYVLIKVVEPRKNIT